MNENKPVTRLELIDAISRLHVINDSPSPRIESFSPILNKSKRLRRKRWTKMGLNR